MRKIAIVLLSVAAIAVCLGTLESAEPKSDPRMAEVRQLIDRYFLSWSRRDFERYGQCFMPTAAVQMIDPRGELVTMPLGPFLRDQQRSQLAKAMTETPERVEIRFEEQLARAVVYWKLVDGERTEYGYDHFTLMNAGGRWRIANLVFYVVKPELQAEK